MLNAVHGNPQHVDDENPPASGKLEPEHDGVRRRRTPRIVDLVLEPANHVCAICPEPPDEIDAVGLDIQDELARSPH